MILYTGVEKGKQRRRKKEGERSAGRKNKESRISKTTTARRKQVAVFVTTSLSNL